MCVDGLLDIELLILHPRLSMWKLQIGLLPQQQCLLPGDKSALLGWRCWVQAVRVLST